MNKSFRVPLKESYLLIIIIVGILSLCMYSSFALFSLEKTTSKDIFTMKAASDIETTLKIFEYKKITVSAGDNASVMVNVNNDTGGSIYYGVFYEMLSPSIKSDDITIAKIDWSANATSGSITNGSILPVELIIINNSSSDITLNIGVAGSDSNELGLTEGKTLITETFNTGEEVTGGGTTSTTDFSYTGAVQTKTLTAGSYKLEVWGAQGGNYSTSALGGKGGYSYGNITLTSDTNVYVYVGGQPASNTSDRVTVSGGFNGGGAGYNRYYSGTYTYGQGGGGASDIRINEDSLYSRVIVAGGGGGAASEDGTAKYGGGTSGGSAQSGYGGSQTSAGTNGSFGTGGSATTSGNNYKYGSGGGGGGWYGGGASSSYSDSTNYRSYNGGGSGYVYTSSTASNYPSGVKLTSTYYLTNAATIAGNTSFTDNDGTTVTGHSGNGHARISNLDSRPSIDTSEVIVEPTVTANLKDIVTCSDNGSGCKIVLVKPSSSKKLTMGSNSIMYVLEDNNGNRYKYTKSVFYGYILKGNAVTAVNNADSGTTGDSGSGVYKVEHSAIASDKSVTGNEIPAVTDYRYYGANPNNYICIDMNGENTCPDRSLYRIIGSIYEENAGQNLIKVVKATPITDGTTDRFIFDYVSTETDKTVNWITSPLATLLNSGAWYNNTTGNYYDTSNSVITVDFTDKGLTDKMKNMINDSLYYLGSTGNGLKKTTAMYGYERSTTSTSDNSKKWEGKIGLMYPSDLGYASGNKCATVINLNNYSRGCASKFWFHKSKTYSWLIMPAYNQLAFGFSSYGDVNSTLGLGPFYVLPVFYLKSDTNIKSGDGTSSNPYLLS